MRKYFEELFAYDNWSNKRILDTANEPILKDDRFLSLMSHVISAKIIWLHRVEGLPTSPFPIWEKYNFREIQSMVDESHIRWMGFLHRYKVETFEEIIHYKDSHGADHESRLTSILTHVINHGTYHRGQAVSRIKELGEATPVTDFINFTRER